jgi:hypothetical protein
MNVLCISEHCIYRLYKTQIIFDYLKKCWLLAGAFAKSEYYPRHVCPSVLMEQLGSHWTDFHEVW